MYSILEDDRASFRSTLSIYIPVGSRVFIFWGVFHEDLTPWSIGIRHYYPRGFWDLNTLNSSPWNTLDSPRSAFLRLVFSLFGSCKKSQLTQSNNIVCEAGDQEVCRHWFLLFGISSFILGMLTVVAGSRLRSSFLCCRSIIPPQESKEMVKYGFERVSVALTGYCLRMHIAQTCSISPLICAWFHMFSHDLFQSTFQPSIIIYSSIPFRPNCRSIKSRWCWSGCASCGRRPTCEVSRTATCFWRSGATCCTAPCCWTSPSPRAADNGPWEHCVSPSGWKERWVNLGVCGKSQNGRGKWGILLYIV